MYGWVYTIPGETVTWIKLSPPLISGTLPCIPLLHHIQEPIQIFLPVPLFSLISAIPRLLNYRLYVISVIFILVK